MINTDWLDAVFTSYLGEYKKAAALLDLYLSSPLPVGGHSDGLFEDIDKQLARMADLKGKMELLRERLEDHEKEVRRRSEEQAFEQAKAESLKLREAELQSKLEASREEPEVSPEPVEEKPEAPPKKRAKAKRVGTRKPRKATK